MDITENVLNISLLDYQKKFLYDLYKTLENGKSFNYIPFYGGTCIMISDQENHKRKEVSIR